MKIIYFFLLLMASCQNDDFKKYTQLENLRVLALTCSTPEVNPGDSVVITAYISDISNSGPYSYVAKACVDPGVSYGAEPSCENNTTAVSIGVGAVTGLTPPNNTGPVTSTLNVTVPASILALSSDVDKYNGVNYLVTYDIANSQGNTVRSFRRILVSDPLKTTKNLNPVISSVFANGVPLGLLGPNTEVDLTVTLSSGAEAYSYKKSDGSLALGNESLIITYFFTDGVMKYYRTSETDSNKFTAPDLYPVTRNSMIVLSIHDGRGGVSVLGPFVIH